MKNPAIFLDRDGTLVHPRHYPTRPEQLVLMPGIAEPLIALQERGFNLVVVTNQSGIARGLITPAQLARMHAYLKIQLAQLGVRLDHISWCPHHPDGNVAEYAVVCSCRKPRPGMLMRASRELDIDLYRSWMVGDILDDIEAGHRANCRSILVDLGTESPPTDPLRRPDYVAHSTAHALLIICSLEGIGACDEIDYLPERWTTVTGLPPQPRNHSNHGSLVLAASHGEGHGHVNR